MEFNKFNIYLIIFPTTLKDITESYLALFFAMYWVQNLTIAQPI